MRMKRTGSMAVEVGDIGGPADWRDEERITSAAFFRNDFVPHRVLGIA
jgi:hypothetical protein